MSYKHPDSMLCLFSGTTMKRNISCSRRNRTVNHVVNLISLKAKNLCQPTSDFINQNHGFQRHRTIQAPLLTRRYRNSVKIVVTKLARKMS